MQNTLIQGTATGVLDTPERLAVVYHNTVVLDVDRQQGFAVLNTVDANGKPWHTATSKRRMNDASSANNLGFRVFQKHKVWFVRLIDGRVLDYFDGMQVPVRFRRR